MVPVRTAAYRSGTNPGRSTRRLISLTPIVDRFVLIWANAAPDTSGSRADLVSD